MLVALSAGAAAAGVAVGVAGFAWVLGPEAAGADVAWTWWGRNVTGTLLVLAPALLLRGHDGRDLGRAVSRLVEEHRGRAVELTALTVATVVALAVLVVEDRTLLVLVGLTVWAAQRLAPAAVAAFTSCVGAAVVVITVLGHGPFSGDFPLIERIVDLQVFVAGLVAVALVLSGAATDHRSLLRRARAAECEAARRAAMFTAVTETLTDGVIVQDSCGTVAAANAAAQAMVLAVPGHPTGMDGACLRLPDGTALADRRPAVGRRAAHRVRRTARPGPAQAGHPSPAALDQRPPAARGAAHQQHRRARPRRHHLVPRGGGRGHRPRGRR